MTARLCPALLAACLAAPVSAQVPVASQVPGLSIVAMDNLPATRGITGEAADFCAHLFIAPATPAGRAVAAQGWSVTAEIPFGPYTAVSFAGAADPATSGTCDLLQGNVGLFSGDRLVALIYADAGTPSRIGSARPFGTGGLRVLSGEVIPAPQADLRLVGATGIAVTPLALDEPVCNGTALVPLVEGLPIDMARALLIAAGWQPVIPADAPFALAADIADAGVPEVQDCSGTGFAFCAYTYVGPAGALSVITAGEPTEDALPAVTGAGVTCATP
jgi:hypothetical protein